MAALSTIEMTCVAVSTPVYMPHLVSLNAARFGFIGVAFALLSWLVVVSVVLVASAVIAPQIDVELSGPAG